MPEQQGFPDVQGRCPACGNERLFLGAGGYVTCPRIDCPEPDAASTLLEQPRAKDGTPICTCAYDQTCPACPQPTTPEA
jgi:hypothetical protein